MNYDPVITTDDHDAAWHENIGTEGVMEITCRSGDSTGAVLVHSGWGHFSVCPVCGSEIDLAVEEAA